MENNTAQISATIEKYIRDKVKEIAEAEKRSFSQMVEILVTEALEARNK